MEFRNAYGDKERARSYAKLEFPATYYLAFRDLPEIFRRHCQPGCGLDFGCGAGRSTRFLAQNGYEAVGVDIATEMIDQAREIDPTGEYRLIEDGDYSGLRGRRFDLVFTAFAFDNIPGEDRRIGLFRGIRGLLKPGGKFLLLGSSPELYRNDWASFQCAHFAENQVARSGDAVFTIMNDVDDKRPIMDILWVQEDYERQFAAAGLSIEAEYRPLGRADEPWEWVNETKVAPWVIYVTAPSG